MIETFFQKIRKHFFTNDFSFIEDLQKYILIVFCIIFITADNNWPKKTYICRDHCKVGEEKDRH